MSNQKEPELSHNQPLWVRLEAELPRTELLFLRDLAAEGFIIHSKTLIDAEIRHRLPFHSRIIPLTFSSTPPRNMGYSTTIVQGHIRSVHLHIRFQAHIPRSIGNLRYATHLTIHTTKKITIPYGIHRMQSLESVALYSRHPIKLPPTIAFLPKLTSLMVETPTLRLPRLLKKIPLTSLSLTTTSPSPAKDLPILPNTLQYLFLTNIQTHYLPQSLFNMPQLRSLHINLSPLRSLPMKLHSLPQLSTISCVNTPISVFPHSLAQSPHLLTLRLISTSLQEISPAMKALLTAPSSLPKSIDIIGNPLTDLRHAPFCFIIGLCEDFVKAERYYRENSRHRSNRTIDQEYPPTGEQALNLRLSDIGQNILATHTEKSAMDIALAITDYYYQPVGSLIQKIKEDRPLTNDEWKWLLNEASPQALIWLSTTDVKNATKWEKILGKFAVVQPANTLLL